MKKEYRIERRFVAKKELPLFSLKEVWKEGREIVYAFDTHTIPQFTSVDKEEEIAGELLGMMAAFDLPFIYLDKSGSWKEVKKSCFRKPFVSQKVKHAKK